MWEQQRQKDTERFVTRALQYFNGAPQVGVIRGVSPVLDRLKEERVVTRVVLRVGIPGNHPRACPRFRAIYAGGKWVRGKQVVFAEPVNVVPAFFQVAKQVGLI